MIRELWAVAMIAVLGSAPVAWSGEAGDAVFADRGPWSLDDQGLRWALSLEGPTDHQGFITIANGSVTLGQRVDPSDGQPVLYLTHKTDKRSREIGPFPVSGGDPALTFFLEQTTRDMAKLTGGSPFYIRNRIKDALFRGGSITREAHAMTARFQPFADDPNAARMQGFESLTLSFSMDGETTPIRDMLAETRGETPGYRLHMVLQ